MSSLCPQGQLGSTQNKGLIPCVLLVLKEMLPTYHKWRYNAYGVRERIGAYRFGLGRYPTAPLLSHTNAFSVDLLIELLFRPSVDSAPPSG